MVLKRSVLPKNLTIMRMIAHTQMTLMMYLLSICDVVLFYKSTFFSTSSNYILRLLPSCYSFRHGGLPHKTIWLIIGCAGYSCTMHRLTLAAIPTHPHSKSVYSSMSQRTTDQCYDPHPCFCQRCHQWYSLLASKGGGCDINWQLLT